MDYATKEIIEKNLSDFDKYFTLLVEWNEKFNLTAITEREEVFVKHFADSVLGAEFIPQGASVLDVGAGAGFPSLPIKITRDDIDLTMNDSLQKRVGFLNEVIAALSLQKARTVHSRAEDLPMREAFDCVVARAVAPLNVLCEYCLPFVKQGGRFIAFKASDCEEEVAAASSAIRILGGKEPKIIRKELTQEITRAFVIIEKITPTPKKYPRGKNLPRKSPL